MRVLVSAGEASGDEHAALVLDSLKSMESTLEVRGMAGAACSTRGMTLDVEYAGAAGVLGFAGPLKNSLKLYQAFKQLSRVLHEWRPDVLLLVNFSDFNLRLAKKARELRVPTLFYIPPQLWAWRRGRVESIKENVGLVASIFPFEVEFYREHGYKNVVYVGHPFVDVIRGRKRGDRESLMKEWGMDPSEDYIVFYPGSRTGEVKRHLPLCIDAFSRLKGIQGAIAVAAAQRRYIEEYGLPDALHLVHGDAFDVMSHAKAGLIKSGTSNLQAAFAGLPFSMFFKTDPLSAALVKRLVKIPGYSIVNIIRQGSVREILQGECNGAELALEARRLLEDELYRERLKEGYREVVDALSTFDPLPLFAGSGSATERVARLVRLVAGAEAYTTACSVIRGL